MTSATLATRPSSHDTVTSVPRFRSILIYLAETKYELRKQTRMPAFMIPTIGFPIMFYVLFGLVMQHGSKDSEMIATYMLATYGAFGVISIALFALGVGVAVGRGQGWLAVKKASPMPLPA